MPWKSEIKGSLNSARTADYIFELISEPIKKGPMMIKVMKSRYGDPDNRPDVVERDYGNGVYFALKAHGDILTPGANDALYWAENSGKPHTSEKKISRNETWLRFEHKEDSALFKLFWL
jgi:hypothetical protein